MNVMNRNTVSTTDLLESAFKEEGLDLASFRENKKKAKEKNNKWKQTKTFIKEMPEQILGDSDDSVLNQWSTKISKPLTGMYAIVWALSLGFVVIFSVLGLSIGLKPYGVELLQHFIFVGLATTMPLVLHSYLIFKNKDKKKEDAYETDQEDGVEVIFSSLNAYIETEREKAVRKISKKVSDLQEEKHLLEIEISNHTKLINEENASGSQLKILFENNNWLRNQAMSLSNQIMSLKKFRDNINKGIDFLIENSSGKASWNLRAAEASDRVKDRIRESEKKLEESRQMVKDVTTEFAQLWGLVTGKLEQINAISGSELTESKEMLDMSKLDEFLTEHADQPKH